MTKTNIPTLTKQFRYQNNVSQRELSELLGVTRVTVANYETGKHMPASNVVLRAISMFPPSHWVHTWANAVLDELKVVAGMVAVEGEAGAAG